MALPDKLNGASSHEQQSIDLATKASNLFIRASLRCPVSVTAQAAYIADHCLADGEDPVALRTALLANPVKVDDIIALAKANHARKDKHVTVRRRKAEGIIYEDFEVAQRLMVLPSKELRLI